MAEETNVTPEVDYKAEFEKMQADYAKLKTHFDKTSSEVADYKRKEKERMTDDEKRNAEIAEMQEHYKAIERENSLYKYKSTLSSFIKDEAVLTNVSNLFADGDIPNALKKYGEYYTKAQSELEKAIRADLLRQNPQPNPTNDGTGMTKEQIMAIKDPVERQSAIEKNIHLFIK